MPRRLKKTDLLGGHLLAGGDVLLRVCSADVRLTVTDEDEEPDHGADDDLQDVAQVTHDGDLSQEFNVIHQSTPQVAGLLSHSLTIGLSALTVAMVSASSADLSGR